MNAELVVQFLCTSFHPQNGSLSFGRDADIVLDENNTFLHRTAGVFEMANGAWVLRNVGRSLWLRLTAKGVVTDFVPGTETPLPHGSGSVTLHAGKANYSLMFEHELTMPDSQRQVVPGVSTHQLRSEFTPGELRYIAVFANELLYGRGGCPSHSDAARILGVSSRTVENVIGAIRHKARSLGLHDVATTEKLIRNLVASGVVRPADLTS